MTETQHAVQLYRLGNQQQQYELIETYLGWKPQWFGDWEEFLDQKQFRIEGEKPKSVILMTTKTNESIELLLHKQILKDAFPMSVHSEKRFNKWHHFYIVSLKDSPTEKFIIPLY